MTLVAANVALPAPAGVRRVAVEHRRRAEAACEAPFATADVLLMAAAVADFRPRDPAARNSRRTPVRRGSSSSRPRTSSPGSPTAAAPGSNWSASPPSTAPARSSTAGAIGRKRLDAVVVNDVAQAGIGFDAAENEVTMVTAEGSACRAGQ